MLPSKCLTVCGCGAGKGSVRSDVVCLHRSCYGFAGFVIMLPEWFVKGCFIYLFKVVELVGEGNEGYAG